MASLTAENDRPTPVFLLTEGGPGAGFMRRLHLVHPQLGTGSGRTAVVLMGVTWLPLLLLSAVDGLSLHGVTVPFLNDITAYVRFLVAVPLLVLADIPIGIRMRQVVNHFEAAHLIREDQLTRFRDTIVDALQFRDSRVAELVVLAFAYIASYNAVLGFSFERGGSWSQPVHGQGLSTAGYWFAFVALPILQFLIFRWVYRMVVWGRFLWKVSKLDLLLTPTHPDSAGGLAFLGKSLIPFGLILFALSAAVSSAIAKNILFNGGKLADYQWSYAALFLLALLVFAGPLLIFVPKLLALKEQGQMEYGILGSEYTQEFHRKWIQKTAQADEPLLGTGDIQSLADLGNSFAIVKSMRIVPAAATDFIGLILPGLVPAVPLAATVMPVGQILTDLLKLVA
jgi:hypothetical protein